MKIKGAANLSPEEIREAVDQGAVLVVYSYCISLLLVSFKRSSAVTFIPPGKNLLLPGLPFTLITLLLGWWGFPWGIFYTLQCLSLNLRGGTDVTDEVLATIDPLDLESEDGQTVPPLPPSPHRRKMPSAFVGVVRTIALLGIIVALIWTGLSVDRKSSVPIAYLNGLDVPYEITVDGETFTLHPNIPQHDTLAEGEHHYSATFPSGYTESGSFEFSSRLGSNPFDGYVVILNPDHLALLYQDDIWYYETPPAEEPETETLIFQARPFLQHPAPDYFFQVSPDEINIGSASRVKRTEFGLLTGYDHGSLENILENYVGREARVRQVQRRGVLTPRDTELLTRARDTLTQPELEQFFALHEETRPVLIAWHRAYQNAARHFEPRPDLVSRYRRALDENPADPALHYLLGRLLRDPSKQEPHFEIALTAPEARPFAHAALANLHMEQARFAAGLEHALAAREADPSLATSDFILVEAYLANEQPENAVAFIRERRENDPTSFSLLWRDVELTAWAHPQDPQRVEDIITTWTNLMADEWDEETLIQYTAYLKGLGAEARGDRDAFLAQMSASGLSHAQYYVALYTGDVSAAIAYHEDDPDSTAHTWLTLYLSARVYGSADQADYCYQRAVQSMSQGNASWLHLGKLLQNEATPPEPAIRQVATFSTGKRVLAMAMADRFPTLADSLLPYADQFAFMPGSPDLHLDAIRAQLFPR